MKPTANWLTMPTDLIETQSTCWLRWTNY